MSLQQALSGKGNVKKATINDVPFSPLQPVINSYYATSTTSQTSIALSFSVSQSNTDQFFLFVDGKKLTLGSGNDFIFTAASVDANGYCANITLNQSLVAGLNIQAYYMGLKKETEFLTDTRFTQLYEAQNQGFQGFVNTQSSLITATSSVGTPGAGLFYSSIVNRAAIPDLTQDLKARMGVERIMFQYNQNVQNEYGPNGEPIFSLVTGDTYGQIRLAGNVTFDNSVGPAVLLGSSGDFVEITFYGTGLNLVSYPSTASEVLASSIDGTSITANVFNSNSAVLTGHQQACNQILPIIAAQTIGIHTVKLTRGGSVGVRIYGVEVLNESSSVKVAPGIGYVQGKKAVNSALSTFAYNAPVTGVRGGRVLVYQNASGTIGQAWTPTNSASALLTSADHTNEEIAREYYFREFGAQTLSTVQQDFSYLANSNSNATYTLDDGTTTLAGNGILVPGSGVEAVAFQTNGGYLQLTFVGTGLDILRTDSASGGSDNYTYQIDGSTAVSFQTAGVLGKRITKIVSGLPYGTHTFKLTRVTASTFSPQIWSFLVYQPKKPTVPAGAVALADYNVMATYVQTAATGLSTIATGVLRKTCYREFTYSGSGWAFSSVGGDWTNLMNGQVVESSTSGATIDGYFFGTGFEARTLAGVASGRSTNITVSLQAISAGGSLLALTTTNFPGATVVPFTGCSFTGSTGLLNNQGAAGSFQGSGIAVTGLALGLWRVRYTANSAAEISIECLDAIVPIHSYKQNVVDAQNSLNVGSQSITDNRQTTPVANLPAAKAWAQAVGLVSGPTTSSTVNVPCPDMSCTIKTSGGALFISWQTQLIDSTLDAAPLLQLYVDGVPIGPYVAYNQLQAAETMVAAQSQIVTVNAGTHKVDLYWQNGGSGTLTAQGLNRILTVQEK